MQAQDIQEKIRAYILREFLPGEDPGQLTATLSLIKGRIIDSLGTLKLVAFLEEGFGFEFQAQEVDARHLDTIEAMTRFVMEKRN
jgi:acyl carrier protein